MKFLIVLIMCAVLGDGYVAEVEAYRQQKDADFKVVGKSPFFTKKERKHFKGLNYFPVDETYRIEAQYQPVAHEDTLEFMTSSGRARPFAKVATLTFQLNGATHTLPAYQDLALRKKEGYADYLFFPFTDATSGNQSYGGGRYIDLRIPTGGTLVLDFNYAYNPLCAYTDGYACPIPKPESRMNVSVVAGERVYH